ncbi:DUF4870 domain-containing protein [Natronomonas sp. CBA1123]|nr:DUF4870 domain-containing protein [Natronomonas sp. CBA1123]
MTETTSSPDLLEQRPITGILVHIFGFLTGLFGAGIVGAGIVYLASSHQFTKENARHALNWHLSITILAIITIVTFLFGAEELETGTGGTIELITLPAPLDTVVTVVAIVSAFVFIVASFLGLIFPFIATGKAIFGTAWKYPLVPEFVSNDE